MLTAVSFLALVFSIPSGDHLHPSVTPLRGVAFRLHAPPWCAASIQGPAASRPTGHNPGGGNPAGNPAPEATTLLLVGSGLLGLALSRRLRRNRAL